MPGLYRRPIVRFVLGFAVLIAIVQILTTLHFSSSQSGQSLGSLHQKTRRDEPHSTLLEYSKNARLTEGLDLRKSKATDAVLEILNQYEDFDCLLTHNDVKSALQRAKTPECRKIIQKTGCLLENNRLYFDSVERICTIEIGKSGYPRAVTDGEALGPPVRVVFMLTVHGRAFRQVKRILKAIYHSNHYYYFHVDLRSDYLYRELIELASGFPNVAVTPWRMATIWGGSSLLQMLLRSLDDLIHKKEWKWDFFINLSESDYPIKSVSHMTEFLTAHRDDNFLKSHGREPDRFIHKQGLDRTFVECDEHMWRIGKRVLPKNIEIDGGSDWIGLNRKFAEYVVKSKDNLVNGLKRIYAFALLPAESFFHTVLRNGPQCETFVKTNLRVTNWKRKLGCRCQYKHVVDWCGCSPNDFKPEDLPRLQKSRYDLFARKFEAIVNQKAINMVDVMLFGDFNPGTLALNTYWESFYHHKDDAHRLTDALRTYFASFSRIGNRYVGSSYCKNLPVGDFKEVTYLKQDDEFSGMLVLQEVGLKGRRSVLLESWFSRLDQEQMMNLNMSDGPNRLAGLQVGTSWDQKERMFRNYGRLMGPWDDPVLVHYWKKGTPFNVKLMWIDPIKVVTGVYEMKVQEDWVVSFHKPIYLKPLRPGTWTVKMVYREEEGTDLVIGQTQFLVIPLAYKDGVPVDSYTAVSANSGPPGGRYTSQFTIEFDRESLNIDALAYNASLNSKKTGEQLHEWIDTLVKENWEIEAACTVGSKHCNGLPQCEMTSWSSRSPDPKSEVGQVSVNGTLR